MTTAASLAARLPAAHRPIFAGPRSDAETVAVEWNTNDELYFDIGPAAVRFVDGWCVTVTAWAGSELPTELPFEAR